MTDFPDRVSPEEKRRRRRVIRGWTSRLDEHNLRFATACLSYLKGYSDDPPAPYIDPERVPDAKP